MRGLKIYSTPEATIAEPAMIPILEKCVELNFVVLAHTTPAECEYLMTAVPECRFMMAHAGGQPFAKGDWNRAIMAAQRFPNLYLETASSTIDTNFVETAVATLGPEKIIFGTDTPLLDPWTQLAKIRETRLTPDRPRSDLGRQHRAANRPLMIIDVHGYIGKWPYWPHAAVECVRSGSRR